MIALPTAADRGRHRLLLRDRHGRRDRRDHGRDRAETLRAAGRRARADDGDRRRPRTSSASPTSDNFIEFFSNLGLGMLFFFAGYEIDFERIQGKPLSSAPGAGLLSVGLAFGIGGILAAAGIVVSFLYTGAAMATTAIGTLIPILRDNGELKTSFGTYLLAAGGAGEFGPILLVTLFFSTAEPAARGGDPDRLRRPGARRRARLGAARLARLAGAGTDLRGEQPAGGAGHRRARLRPGPAREPARPRRPARRLRRRDDHPHGAEGARADRSSSRS